MFACECICICVVSAGSPLHNDSILPHRLLPAGLWRARGEGQALLLRSCALAAALVAAGQDPRAAEQDGRQLLLACVENAGDAHYALLRRRLGC